MFATIKQLFSPKNKDIRKRILFTFATLFVFKIGTSITVPGVNLDTANLNVPPVGAGSGNPGGTSMHTPWGSNGPSGNQWGVPARYGKNGTGGLLILYTNNMINNSTIYSNGVEGGYSDVGGGATGGGSINIFYKQNYTIGNIYANGGNAVGSYRLGGRGGQGSISVGQIVDGSYVSRYTNY